MNDKEVLLILLAAVGLWLALIAGQLIVSILRTCRMRLAPGSVQRVGRAEMPGEIAAILNPVAERLLGLGFAYQETLLVQSALRSGDPEPIWLDIHVHVASATRALLQLSDTPEPGLLVALAFHSRLGDRHLRTENRRLHLHFPFPQNWEVVDAAAASIEDHWLCHQQRLPLGEPGDAVELSAQDIELQNGEYFDYWQEIGFMRHDGDFWHLTWRGAWRLLRQVMAGNRRVAQLPPMRDLEPPAIRQFADLRAWHFQERLLASIGMPWRSKALWFAGSAVAGLLALAWLDSLHTAGLILGILLFHEFGHALAMRWLGYRELGVLVLPFLGAVALGRKDDAGPWQKLFLLLAGPLPGLIIGALCLRFAMDDHAQHGGLLEAGALFLVINLFNLLPFTPLDGGQIVETFLFTGRPRLRFGFFVCSALALVGLGYALESPVLAGAGLLLTLGIRSAWRRIGLLRGLTPVGSSEAAAEVIFQRLHAAPGERWPIFGQRIVMVRSLLPFLRGRAPVLFESLAGTAIYLAAIALPLLLLWGTPLQSTVIDWATQHFSTEAKAPDWQKQLAAATSPEGRWQVLYDAGQWFDGSEQPEVAILRFREALAETEKMPPTEQATLHRLDTQIALARLAGGESSVTEYVALLPALRALPAAEQGRLAEVLEALNWLEFKQASRRIAYLREAVAVREALSDEAMSYFVHQDRLELARLLDADGDTAAAEKLLRQNLVADENLNPWFVEPIAWFFIAHGRAAEAESILRQPSLATEAYRAHAQALGWAYLAQYRQGEAIAFFSGKLASGEQEFDKGRQRLGILLDLVHASAGRTEDEARWLAEAAQIKESLGKKAQGFRRSVRREAESNAWESMRGKARLLVLGRLPGAEEEARQDEMERNTCR